MSSREDRALILDMLDTERGLSGAVFRRVWADKVRSDAFMRELAALVDLGVVVVGAGGRLFKKAPQ